MQFLSQSTGFTDILLLCMAPLGIITIIVSAIRVGGPTWLKAAIGRGRENLAVAEVELMSSTSPEVGELWNGSHIVRCMGAASVRDFVWLAPKSASDSGGQPEYQLNVQQKSYKDIWKYISTESWAGRQYIDLVSIPSLPAEATEWDLRQAAVKTRTEAISWIVKTRLRTINQTWLSIVELGHQNAVSPQDRLDSQQATNLTHAVTRRKRHGAPNITLNLQKPSRNEVRIAAAIGLVIQLAVITYAACVTYYPTTRFLMEENRSVLAYAFPCFATGTVALALGLFMCADVVDRSTKEDTSEINPSYQARHIWLQRKATVGDQVFRSYAVFRDDSQGESTIVTSQRVPELRYSFLQRIIAAIISGVLGGIRGWYTAGTQQNRKARKSYEIVLLVQAFQATFGTFLSLVGFVLQFVGLRGLHWSTSVVQLGSIVFMTAIRVLVRRAYARHPKAVLLRPNFELEWLTFSLAEGTWPMKEWEPTTEGYEEWQVVTGQDSTYQELKSDDKEIPYSRACQVMAMRKQLGALASWRSLVFTEATVLKRAMEVTVGNLLRASPEDVFYWQFNVRHRKGELQPVIVKLDKKNGIWVVDEKELEAVLSLWLYSVDPQLEKENDGDDETSDDVDRRERYQDAWLAEEEPDQWLSAEGVLGKKGLQLLGPASPQLLQDLQWWLPRDLGIFEKLQPAEVYSSDMKRHRIVGLGQKPKPPMRADGVETSDTQSHESDNEAVDEETQNRPLLARVTYQSLKVLYAQDLFSSFIRAVAKTMDGPIQGNADAQTYSTSDSRSWSRFKLHHEQLSKLVNDLDGVGFGSLEDIYTSVIPALSAEDKLPGTQGIIELARRCAMPYEEHGKLTQAGEIYIELFDMMRVFPTESTVVARATAVLVEHMRQVTMMIAYLQRGYRVGDSEVSKLRYHREALTQRLAGSEYYSDALKRLYRHQRRDWAWKSDELSNEAAEDRSVDKTTATPQGEPMRAESLLLTEFPKSFQFTELHALDNSVGLLDQKLRDAKSRGIASSKDIHDWTPLHYSVLLRPLWVARQLLEDFHTEVNALDLLGWTPLHYACLGDKDDTDAIVRLLMDHGAHINARGWDGTSPLHCAAKHGYVDAARTLVEAGAAVDALDSTRMSPFMWALLSGQVDVSEYLYEFANKKLRDVNGRTSLHLAAMSNRVQLVKLVAGDVAANSRDKYGSTALHLVSSGGASHVITALIETCHADVHAIDAVRQTPLHRAARAGREDNLIQLLEHGVRLYDRDGRGATALHFAAESGREKAALSLLEAGSDRGAEDVHGMTPRDYALKGGHTQLVDLLGNLTK